MNRKILALVALIGIFGFGSATALLVPVGFTTSDNVKMYTKTTLFDVGQESTGGFELFCDEEDTIINGYVKDIQGAVDQHSILQSNAIQSPSGLLEGYKVRFNNGAVTQTFEGTIVCAKVIPLSIIGGMLLQPDTTALFLAYGIANAIWLAPTLAGIGIGVYLTKSKWKKSENS